MQPNLTALYQQPPVWLAACFGLITAIAVVFFYVIARKAVPRRATSLTVGLLVWLGFLGVLASQDFFLNLTTTPPRFLLVVGPAIGTVIALCFIPAGQRFYDALPLKALTYFHIIRVPVEVVLLGLFLDKQIPEMMTFEGYNVDILSGLTAPIIGLLVFHWRALSFRWLLVWNMMAFGLLLIILSIAFLSAPTFLQKLNFDQPNLGVFKFPFVWLPGFVAPFVGLCHVAAIRQLIRQPAQ